MKVFISYQFGDDISGILSLLHDKHIDVFDSLTDIQYGTSFQKTIKTSIAEADFILLVYTKTNTNLSFEAGVAVALNKPLFVILSPQIETQDYLFESTYVHALPEEISKIDFSLNLFLNNLKPKKAQAESIPVFYGGGDPAPSDYFYNKFIQIKNLSEYNYESLFREIFQLYHLNVVENIRSKDLGADFSIWSDMLSNVLTNPILVEVKKHLNRKTLEILQSRIYDILEKSPNSSFLIFYEDFTGTKKELPNNSKCLYIQIADLMSNLRETGFNEAIIKIRNQIVHNAY